MGRERRQLFQTYNPIFGQTGIKVKDSIDNYSDNQSLRMFTKLRDL